ncbi:YeeE/YedE family protein [Persephonella atlantica]|uniref:YeeE/YedE family protein n=1 Tax=Persephonella atlantica TaxID=2699429 RepID=A0ABS1GK91_9AQUI|nr:YeeE/YedE thiosulfate transporter family protein [Persephonella atlantica]MBK3333358.1 YeeE/YedE family protein [Persephonella atlantica]
MLKVFFLGMIFGAIMQLGFLDRLSKVVGAFLLKDLTIPKALMIAMGVGAILIYTGEHFGLLQLHIKPFYPVGIALGGLVFGTGMVIVGYCPGSMPEAVGEGRMDAFLGIVSGVIGGIIFTVLYPVYHNSFLHGPTFGAPTLTDLMGLEGISKMIVGTAIGGTFVVLAFVIDWLEKKYIKN